jgi:hypothetical protein
MGSKQTDKPRFHISNILSQFIGRIEERPSLVRTLSTVAPKPQPRLLDACQRKLVGLVPETPSLNLETSDRVDPMNETGLRGNVEYLFKKNDLFRAFEKLGVSDPRRLALLFDCPRAFSWSA